MQKGFSDCLEFEVPDGGLAIWVRGQQDFPFQPWLDRCRARGVLVHSGNHFSFYDKNLNSTRIGFAAFDPTELKDALYRMRSAL